MTDPAASPSAPPDADRPAVGVILGSAFDGLGRAGEAAGGLRLSPEAVDTPWGAVTLYRASFGDAGVEARPAYVRFRHERPHRLLPHHVPYRAQAWAFRAVGCGALLVTSSVGVLTPALPLYRPLLVTDLLMPDNRLPDGTACSIFEAPSPEHGHLVLNEGLFSSRLTQQVAGLMDTPPPAHDVVFGYAGGPRTKTAAENRLWAAWGAHVNSMTLAPEVVLANELGMPCAGLVVGHKYSVPGIDNPDEGGVAASLDASREAMVRLVHAFLRHGRPVPFANHLYRFAHAPDHA